MSGERKSTNPFDEEVEEEKVDVEAVEEEVTVNPFNEEVEEKEVELEPVEP